MTIIARFAVYRLCFCLWSALGPRLSDIMARDKSSHRHVRFRLPRYRYGTLERRDSEKMRLERYFQTLSANISRTWLFYCLLIYVKHVSYTRTGNVNFDYKWYIVSLIGLWR